MITKTKKQLIAKYDECECLSEQIEYFQNDKQEFLVSVIWDEERDVKNVTDKEIEDYFYNDESIYESHREYFIDDLDYEFKKHIGKKVFVKGRLMTWRNLDGVAEFTLDKTEDLFYKIKPNTNQLTYKMEKTNENEYEVKISHHDSPTGEFYNIKIK